MARASPRHGRYLLATLRNSSLLSAIEATPGSPGFDACGLSSIQECMSRPVPALDSSRGFAWCPHSKDLALKPGNTHGAKQTHQPFGIVQQRGSPRQTPCLVACRCPFDLIRSSCSVQALIWRSSETEAFRSYFSQAGAGQVWSLSYESNGNGIDDHQPVSCQLGVLVLSVGPTVTADGANKLFWSIRSRNLQTSQLCSAVGSRRRRLDSRAAVHRNPRKQAIHWNVPSVC